MTQTVAFQPVSEDNDGVITALPGQGCPLLLRFGKDIPLDDASLSAGVACNTNFSVEYTVNNPYTTGSTA